MDGTAQELGQQIRALRKARGWSQGELGQRVGVPGMTIGHFEIGYRKPTPEMRAKLAAVLGMPALLATEQASA